MGTQFSVGGYLNRRLFNNPDEGSSTLKEVPVSSRFELTTSRKEGDHESKRVY